MIKDHRMASKITLRGLGTRLGVTAAAVQQYERAEQAGTIKLKTLERVLVALDLRYTPEVERIPPGQRREEAVNLALHKEVAKRLIDSPDAVRQVARANLPKIRANVTGHGPAGLIREWEKLLSTSTNVLVSAMLDESRHGSELRQNTPFAGVVPQEVRLRVIAGVPR